MLINKDILIDIMGIIYHTVHKLNKNILKCSPGIAMVTIFFENSHCEFLKTVVPVNILK